MNNSGFEFIDKFGAGVGQYIADQKVLLEDTDGESVNVRTVESRNCMIEQLTSMLAIINATVGKLETALNKAKSNQTRDMLVVDSLISRMNGENEWKSIARKPARKQIGAPPPLGVKTKVKVSETLGLNAIRVANFDQVAQDGEMYYVDSCDHFAFRLAGRLFHGNVGTIYTDEKNPEKIKDCRFAASCNKQEQCDYYHDPRLFPGSKDRRNYIASSWMYAPPQSRYDRGRARRFGSREHLDSDILSMNEENIARYHSQTTHDVICSLLLPS